MTTAIVVKNTGLHMVVVTVSEGIEAVFEVEVKPGEESSNLMLWQGRTIHIREKE